MTNSEFDSLIDITKLLSINNEHKVETSIGTHKSNHVYDKIMSADVNPIFNPIIVATQPPLPKPEMQFAEKPIVTIDGKKYMVDGKLIPVDDIKN